MSSPKLSEAARQAKNAYQRALYRKHREEKLAKNAAYWERKAAEAAAGAAPAPYTGAEGELLLAVPVEVGR